MAAARSGARKGTTRGGAKSAAKTRIQEGSWREPQPAPVVLVSGAEEFFAHEAITTLRGRMRAADPSLEVTEIDAQSSAPGELTTFVSPSLFMEPRLVIASNVHQTSDAFLAEALDLVANPVDEVVVVFRHVSGVRGKKLLDAIRAREDAIEIACAPLKAHELFDFVMQEFRVHQRRIDPQAAQALVSAYNTDLAELVAACRQLMDVTDEPMIDAELVERYHGGRVETNGFKIAEAAIAGNLPTAMSLVRAAFDTGVNEVPIVAAFAMKLRTMARVSDLRGSDAQLAGQVGAAPWQIGQARRDLRNWSDDELATAVRLTAETDFLVKGGARDKQFAVERLVRRVAAREL